jgi:hypothetical protein
MQINITRTVLSLWIRTRKPTTLFLIVVALFFALISSAFKTYEKLIANTELIRQLNRLFNVSQDGSLARWYSALLLAEVILLCIVIVVTTNHLLRWHRYYWIMLGLGSMLILTVKVASLHVALEELAGAAIGNENYYMLGTAGLVILALTIIIIRYGTHFFSALPHNTKILLIGSGIFFLLGALVFERLSEVAWFATNSPNLIYEYVSSVEEFLEMFGIILLRYTLLDYLYRFS